MIHQMMLLMHVEMQLRQQALVSYQEARDPSQRMQRLDDVMALNEQLNEVGSILGMLLNTPFDRGASVQLAARTESPPARHHSPSTVGSRFETPVSDESSLGSLLPRFRFQVDADSDDDDSSTDEFTDDIVVSSAASNVADADNDGTFDDNFRRADSSSGSSVWNSYDFVSLMPSSHRQARNTVAHTVNADRVSAGIPVSTSVNNGISCSSVISGSGRERQQVASTLPVSSTSTVSGGGSSVLLSRRRDHPRTPRRMTVEHVPVSVTVNELQPSVGVRSQAGIRTAPSQTVTLPQIQSAAGAVAPVSQTPLAQNGDQLTMAGRQLTVSGSSSGTPRQLEPLSRNRSSARCNTLVGGTDSQQMLPASSRVAQQVPSSTSGSSSTSGMNASQQLVSTQPLVNGSSVLTEPWPVLPATEQRVTASVSNRSRVSQAATSRNEANARGGLARNSHLSVGAAAATRGPRRTVQEMHNNHPALQLRRSSVRNPLSRPAGPGSVSTLRPSAPQGARVVPLPHPPVRGSRQQGFNDHNAADSRTTASNDILRPRRRSEIAHDIMFPPQKDTEP